MEDETSNTINIKPPDVDLEKLMQNLAQSRAEQQVLSNRITNVKDMLKNTVLGKELKEYEDLLAQKRNRESEIDALIRSTVYMQVSLTNFAERKPIEGIAIKEFKITKIADQKKALVWAVSNMPSALKLDEKKLASATSELELDFLTHEVEYRVQIASDLSAYLDRLAIQGHADNT